jgi:F-box-like
MAPKLGQTLKRVTSKLGKVLKRTAWLLQCLHGSNGNPSDGDTDAAGYQEKVNHVNTLVGKLNNIATTVNSRRKSMVSRILRRRQKKNLGIPRSHVVLPPEILGEIASFMTQHELLKFSRVSRDAYTAAERHLYRRPFTRRFDKLLRTLETCPYKADLILELTLGFDADFYPVKYTIYPSSANKFREPCYDRERVYSAILSRARNLQHLIYQGWLQWIVSFEQPFAIRHPYVMTLPARVQAGVVPVEVLHNIPSTLKHLQFQRIYGKYHKLLEVIQRNDSLESLNLYEIGDLESLHLGKIVGLPMALNLRALRIRQLPYYAEIDHGALVAEILPHLVSLETLSLELSSMREEPLFSTFVSCRCIHNLKIGYCDRITIEGVAKLAQHSELRTLELMPCLRFDLKTLRAIIDGNPHLTLLLLPREAISEKFQKLLP